MPPDPAPSSPSRTLRAASFGAVGDGVADDGPAIARMLEAASGQSGVTLAFDAGRIYGVRSARTRYVFDLQDQEGITLDGGGSVFELASHLRFLRLRGCRRITVRRLKVDFRPLPFADGVVVGVDQASGSLTVRVAPDDARRLIGGPTHEDGEQAFFGILWYDGPYSTIGRHYWLARTEPTDRPDTVRAIATEEFTEFSDIRAAASPGSAEGPAWRISLPAPGIAHRYGPGACFSIRDNDTASFTDVELWSAPWMGFEVARNTGRLTFRRVHVRQKPGSGRLMSTCRDGFHVKGNRAELVWDGCILSGMTDDAFNISTHGSVITRMLAPNRVEVRQKFPLLFIPWRVGSLFVAADERARKLLGRARVTHVETGPLPPPIQGEPAAPVSALTLDRPITGLKPDALAWDASSANPRTTLRNCRIEMSCRLQSPVTLDRCEVTALLWFYCDPLEGPFPGPVTITKSALRRGRGNPVHAVIFSGASDKAESGDPPRAIHDVTFRDNTVYGGFVMEGVEKANVEGNRFLEADAPFIVMGNHRVRLSGNWGPGGRSLP
ncbi:MAG: hypothetical protein GX446_13370 [Chthonomonadales bacterium]|nr:hypothetical protein [Chthonomonadales bacterium]